MTHPYATTTYAQAFSYYGRVLNVPEWGTSVVIRDTGMGCEDASGLYPIAIMDKSADIASGLDRLRQHNLVSIVMVLDDYHRPPLEEIAKHFTVLRPFKTHYIYKPSPQKITYSKHHRYEIRQALKSVRVSKIDLNENLETWVTLYSNLVDKKDINGLQSFPNDYHRMLSELNGVTAVGAWQDDELVSCHLWVDYENRVHSHLAASNPKGYKARAAYAVNDASLDYFSNAKIINIGGSAGQENNITDGLARFKRGFSNDTALSYICGAVLDEKRYSKLVQQKGLIKQTDFFPAYRAPN